VSSAIEEGLGPSDSRVEICAWVSEVGRGTGPVVAVKEPCESELGVGVLLISSGEDVGGTVEV
jgi:hypothetical protein